MGHALIKRKRQKTSVKRGKCHNGQRRDYVALLVLAGVGVWIRCQKKSPEGGDLQVETRRIGLREREEKRRVGQHMQRPRNSRARRIPRPE